MTLFLRQMSSEIKIFDFVQSKLYEESSSNDNDSGFGLKEGFKNI